MTALTRPALEDLAALALEAGLDIMEVWRRGVVAQEKLDGSPVTIADRRAEAIIEAGLARLAPGVPVVAAEACSEGRTPERSGAWFLVDPLDGTKEFVSTDTGEFTVNIALIEAGVPVMGVVYAPKSGRLYAGGPEGAWLRLHDPDTGAERAPARAIHVAAGEAGRLRGVASRRSGGGETDEFLVRAGAPDRRPVSSSLKFCILAEGEADLYPRFGPTNEWDLAAGHAVLAAAGGGVMTCEGAPLRYRDEGRDFLIPRFVAYGGPHALAAARQALGC